MTSPVHTWADMIRFLRRIQDQNDDAVIIIDGPEGSGKSTLAFMLCCQLEDDWDPDMRLVIDYQDWLRSYETKQTGCAYLLDEGGNLAFSRDAMSGQNKHVVKILQMARILNNIVVICCPNAHWLDKYLREHRALIYIRVHKEYVRDGVMRGRATVHWKMSRFNPGLSQDSTGWWSPAFDVRFHGIPDDNQTWRRYEALKREKIEISAAAMQKKGAKNA